MNISSVLSPTEIIASGEWPHALFLTYSLSLSFFETRLLRPRRHISAGRDWHIIADLDGYGMSLGERLSDRVGVEYRITPAALGKGVFHAKIAYLAGEFDNVLILGSGNLTFGGHGRNVECAEVLHASEEPGVFRELVGFFSAVAARMDLSCPELKWAKDFGAHAQSAAERSVGTGEARLLHCASEPVGDQLAILAMNLGRVRTVRVLSPFFDTDAAGIIEFAEVLEAEELVIGLLPGQEHTSGFPFGAMCRTRLRVSAAHIETEEPERRLHAKWFEIVLVDGRRVVMTGSVNATRKSLLTADNVEAAIVRIESADAVSPLGWKPCALPGEYTCNLFQAAGLGRRAVLMAHLEPDGVLQGRLIAKAAVAGTWEAQINLRDGSARAFQLQVDPNGTFRHSQGIEGASLQDARGARLEVWRDKIRAEAWIMADMLLAAVHRGLPACVFNMVYGEHTLKDEVELLNYLMQSAQQHLSAFVSPQSGATSAHEPKHDREDEADLPILLTAWTAEDADLQAENSGHTPAQIATDRAVTILLSRIRSRLIESVGADRERTELARQGDGDSEDTDNDEDIEERLEEHADALEHFRDSMHQLVDRLPAGPARAAALVMWLEVELPLLIRHSDESQAARSFALQWVGVASEKANAGQNRALTGHVTALHVVLSLEQLRSRHVWHRELLEVFWKGPLPADQVEALGLFLAPPPFTVALSPGVTGARLLAAMKAIMEAPSISEQIIEIERMLKQKLPLPPSLPMLESPAGDQLVQEVAGGQNVRIERMKRGSTSCPKCYVNLSQSAQSELKSNRFTRCTAPTCQRFLVMS